MTKPPKRTELPKEVFIKAEEAWECAIAEDKADRIDVRMLRTDLRVLKNFRKAIEKAFNRMPDSARGHIDGIKEYNGDIIKEPDWKKILYDKIDYLNEIVLRSRGDNQMTDVGLDNIGLRAFANVLREFWLLDPKRRWANGKYDEWTASGERRYSPAEHFLFDHAREVDGRVTLEHARTVIKKPYSAKK